MTAPDPKHFDEPTSEVLEAAEGHVKHLLSNLGEDPAREGLIKTPHRVAKSLHYLTHGYQLRAREILKAALFESESDEMVIVKDIELYSLCEHHMLPFFGRAHVAYLPKNHIVGLSKLARVVDVYARRLQVQERLTTQVAQAVQDALDPKGVAVVIEAKHLCMMMRGVTKQNSETVTSCMLGRFRSDPKTRSEFFELL